MGVTPDLPPLPEWASQETRHSLTRDLAVHFGRELLQDDGAGGWDHETREALRGHPSPIVRDVAMSLPRGRRWKPYGVAARLCAALDLHGGDVRYVAECLIRSRESCEEPPSDPPRAVA